MELPVDRFHFFPSDIWREIRALQMVETSHDNLVTTIPPQNQRKIYNVYIDTDGNLVTISDE